MGGKVTRALIVLPEPLSAILRGTKTWEIRSRATRIRGHIALLLRVGLGSS
jgi:hypothetical protein